METFTLEQAYYIGELVATTFIIVSIVFLAIEVRQNTQSSRLANMQALSANYHGFTSLLAQDESLADLYQRGCLSIDGLTDIEKVRFGAISHHIFRIFADAYEQNREGGMRNEIWEARRRIHIDMTKSPGLQTMWQSYKHWHAEDFQSYFDERIEKADTDATPLS